MRKGPPLKLMAPKYQVPVLGTGTSQVPPLNLYNLLKVETTLIPFTDKETGLERGTNLLVSLQHNVEPE